MFNHFPLSARRFAVLTSCGLLLASTACQKEQDFSPSPRGSVSQADVKEQEPIAVRGGRHLKFKSRKDFEKTMREIGKISPGSSVQAHLEKWEKAHNFYSLRAHKSKVSNIQNSTSSQSLVGSTQLVATTQFTSNNEPVTEGDEILGTYETPATEQDYLTDDYLASVLSPDYTVQIGEYIYRLDADTDRVYYIPADSENLYEELASTDTPSSPDIYWYPTDQNVLDLQDAGIAGEPATSLRWNIGIGSGIGCGAGADRDRDDGGVIYSKNQRLDCKLVYEKAGFYFSIIAKAQNQKKVLGIWWSQAAQVSLLPRPGAMWEELCVGYGSSDFNGYSNTSGYGDGNTVARRYYQSTRGLKSYNCTVAFSVGNTQAGPFHIEFIR